ncbi:MAG TPA: hypothetical protein VGC42_20975 [Kofleriaceae bacterium]
MLAKTKFASFNLKVPQNWQTPQGQPGEHYSRAFKPEEKQTAPAVGAPVLFQPQSLNKYHTDTQKMLHAKFSEYIDGICDAICTAWDTWQKAATMTGLLVVGPTVSVGQIIGPPLYPLIMAKAPKATPQLAKYSNAIAQVISTAWLAFTATIKVPGLPLFPAYAALPTPVAPPMPHPPIPLATLPQMPATIMTQALKAQKLAMHADPTAQYAPELFEAVAYGFEQSYNLWKTTTTVNNILVIATGGTPISPLPAAGTGTMPPGGLM